jgi:sugar fermentation stimulation protein A
MRLPPLIPGILARRHKRFLADVELADGRIVVARCADPGRMPTLSRPGLRVWLSEAAAPRRRLDWKLELVEEAGTLVCVDPLAANRVAREALEARRLPALAGWQRVVPEVAVGNGTRLDFRLEVPGGRPIWLEVKAAGWRRGARSAYPDAPTARGRRHLARLADLARRGDGAAILFVCPRGDVTAVEIAADIDPAYAVALAAARAAGVRAHAFRCKINLDAIEYDREVPLV